MNQKLLFALWGILFSLCAALGFIPEPSGIFRSLLTALAVICFVPPGMLIAQAAKAGDSHTLKLVRNLSALSLGTTLVLLILNFLTAMASPVLGNFLYSVLVMVSSPMICSGYWSLSLFLWACLLMASLKYGKKEKEERRKHNEKA